MQDLVWDVHKDLPPWTIDDVWPIWEDCCRILGVDRRKIKVIFYPGDDLPDWFDPVFAQVGEARWEDFPIPEILVLLVDNWLVRQTALMVRYICLHELTHVILPEACEQEVLDISDTILRRRQGWKELVSYLRDMAYSADLGPCHEGMTLFQWAKFKKKGRANKAR